MRLTTAAIVILCLACLSQPAVAQGQLWQNVSIPEICSYQIPPTVEIQKGTYKQINEKFLGKMLEIAISPDCVVAQPKGINSFDPQALKRYCRIIVETERGACGEYEALDAPFTVSPAELREVDAMLKQQMKQTAALSTAKGMKMKLLSWQPAKIVNVNGATALRTTYTRSMNDAPPVLVNMYMIQNNDRMHTITISYRVAEKNIWAADLGKVINTFKFKKR